MKAAVCYEYDQPLVVEEVALQAPQRGEVRVRMRATAICHSDIHLLRGDWRRLLPVVAGHEAAGVVEEVGEDVTIVNPGDHVVASLLRSCGRCFYCTTGSSHICEAEFALQKEQRIHSLSGDPIYQGIYTGAFAEEIVVDQSQLVPIPKEVPFESAALVACGVITGFGAVVNTAKVPAHSSVVIIGAGGVGLNAVQGAVQSGAHPIITIDLIESKLEASHSFGATHSFNAASQTNLAEAIRELTSGRGADYVFVTVGSTTALEQGLTLTRRDGTLVIVGIPPTEATAEIKMASLVQGAGSYGGPTRILGSFMGSTRLSVDVPKLVDLYQQGGLMLDELISGQYPLEKINEAIEVVESGSVLRNVITFD